MTTEEHEQLVKMARDGRILIGVEPAVARRFFTDPSSENLRKAVGESVAFQRLVVLACLLLGPVSLMMSWVLAVFAFGWWGILAGLVALLAWASYNGRASMGKQRIIGTAWFLALAIAAGFLGDTYLRFQIWLVAVAASFFFSRLTYYSAVGFVRSLVLRNRLAFELLSEKALVVRQVG